jgi:hypothetical protein
MHIRPRLKEVRMSCPLGTRGSFLLGSLLLTVSFAAGCTTAAGDDEATAPFGIAVSPMYITIENRTGNTLVNGKVELIPAGRMVSFAASWPRMETAEKRQFMLDATFHGNDGTPFRRGVVRPRRVRVSATDLSGKKYEREVPFE